MIALLRAAAAAIATVGLSLSGLAVAGATLPAHADDATTTTATPRTDQLAALTLSDPDAQAALNTILAALPQHSDPAAGGLRMDALTQQGELSEVTDAVIDPSQYSCSTTDLTKWLYSQLGSDSSVLNSLSQLGVLDYPLYYALRFEHGGSGQYFGPDGEYTTALTHEFSKLKGFWDIDSSRIEFVGMHSDFFDDPARFAPFLQWYWGVDAATAQSLVPQFQTLINALPGGAKNPVFTFNSFAYPGSTTTDPTDPLYGIPPKVMMGDGIPEGYQALGFDTLTVEEAVTGHEYGHQVQFADDLTFDEPTAPESTEDAELQADAFGTYFLVHPRGEAINRDKVLTTEKTFYQVGDCSYTSDSHHGTPNQRQRSSTWAADLTNQARPQAPIVPSLKFDQLFRQELPTILAPDA